MGDDDRVGGGPITDIVWRGKVRKGQGGEGIDVTLLDGVTITTGERDLEARDSLASLWEGVRRMGFLGTRDIRPQAQPWTMEGGQ